MGKREENKNAIREKLLSVGLALFSEQGFEHTTVSDIVAKSEIGRGTYYNYFPDVKTLFDEVLNQMNTEIRSGLSAARIDAESLYDLLYVSFKGYLDFVSGKEVKAFLLKNRDYIRATSFAGEGIRGIIKDLQAAIKTHDVFGPFEKEYEMELLSYVMVGTPLELFMQQDLMDIEVSNDELAVFLTKLFTQGLSRRNK